ncbi:unnamed protein product, partial [Symbiodinium microadriaticum]
AQTLGGAAQGGLALLAQLVEEAIEPPPNTREEGPPPPELRQAPPKVIECDGSPPAPDLFESLVIPGPTAKRSDAAAALSEGEKVHVWSKSRGIWIEDGVVQEISKVDVQILGEPIYKGSVFVVFNEGSNSKWVRPTDIQRLLRRPGASPTAQAAATGSPAAGAGTPMAPGTGKDGTEEQAPDADAVAELQEELRQARGDLLALSKSNEGLLTQLKRERGSNTALQQKLDDQTRMLQKEQEFNAALVDGLRQQGTQTCSKASGRHETVACWEYLEQEPDAWRRYLPDAEKALEEARSDKLPELTISSSGFMIRYRINLSAMTQTNVETGRTRTIRRREILLHADAVLKMTTETQTLRGENQRLTVDLCRKSGEIQALEQNIRGLQENIEAKTDIIRSLKAKIRSLSGEIDELHASHERTEECLVEAQHTARKLEVRHAELQFEHALMKANMEKLQSALKQERQKLYTTVLSQLPPKPLDESTRGFCRSLDIDDPKHLVSWSSFNHRWPAIA